LIKKIARAPEPLRDRRYFPMLWVFSPNAD
jgi:hypothetical protein